MKETLLNLLQKETLVTLKPSAIHGIGVFAVKDIPKGCRDMFSRGFDEWIKLTFEEVEALPEASRNLINNFCLNDKEGYFVPSYGFKMMDLVVYLNHSETPNIKSINDGEFFETVELIPAGTELLVNYASIV